MSNEYIITLVVWFLLYLSFWLNVDHSSQKSFGSSGRTGFISKRVEKIISPFRWYGCRPTLEYVLGLALLIGMVVIGSLKILTNTLELLEGVFSFGYNLSRCIVLGVILVICIRFCFTVKDHPVKRVAFYLTGIILTALLIAIRAYPFIV